MTKTAQMQIKTAQMQIRIDPDLKSDAEGILSAIGLSPTEFVRMSLRQLVMRKGLPFEARIPNAETREAIKDYTAEKVAGQLERFESVDALFESLDSEVGEESTN